MPNRRPLSDQEQCYWLLVAKPEYYLDENGNDSHELEPGRETTYWSCHADTRIGDLALLWRTRPRSDIGYLLEAASDAVSSEDDEWNTWTQYACHLLPLYKFENPVTLDDLRDDPYLSQWGVLKAQFQGTTFRLDLDIWEHLNRLCASKNAGYTARRVETEKERTARPILLEIDLENHIASDPSILAPFGYDLSFGGRQVVCSGGLGRIDIICHDHRGKGFVVIELKNHPADAGALTQIQMYMSWVRDNLANGQRVRGIVISRGSDPRFRAILKEANRLEQQIEQIDLAALGFE